MRNYLRIGGLAVLLAISVACDGIATGFKVGLIASKPFVTSLVTSNTINQTEADLVNGDIDDSVNALGNAEDCLRSAKLYTGRERQVEKGKCYLHAANDLRSILARHNFDVDLKLNRIASIAEGAIAAFEEYNRSVSGTAASSEGGDPDKQLKAKLKDLRRQLKEATGQ